MTKRPMLKVLALLALVAASLPNGPAKAEPRALISLHEGGQLTWERRLALQEALRKRFGFAETRFLVDATQNEVPAAVKRFLEDAPDEDDRRLVWISGLDRRHELSVCPDPEFAPIRPAAPSLILAPACFATALLLPQGARHFAISAPNVRTREARVGRVDAKDAPWIAHLALPADDARFVQAADTLIADHLAIAPGGALDAGDLLHLLRARFRWNGSEFTPTLDVFDRGVTARAIHPLALDASRRHSWSGRLGRRIEARRGAIQLYDRPAMDAAPAVTVERPATIRLLRNGADERMRFVMLGQNMFGWVRAADLEF
ncbi:MAG: hypothetical protein VW338_06785 [Rhodospirillaceae bacterium]